MLSRLSANEDTRRSARFSRWSRPRQLVQPDELGAVRRDVGPRSARREAQQEKETAVDHALRLERRVGRWDTPYGKPFTAVSRDSWSATRSGLQSGLTGTVAVRVPVAGSIPHVLVQKPEDVRLPHRHVQVDQVVPLVSGPPKGWINHQAAGPPKPLQLGRERLPWLGRVVVRRMEKEDWARLADRGQKPPLEFGRAAQLAAAAPKTTAARSVVSRAARSSERAPPNECPDDGDSVRVNLRPRPKERDPGKCFVQCLGLQQLQLHPTSALLATCREGAVHQIAVRSTLAGGKPDAAPKEKEEGVPVPCEHAAERCRLVRGHGVRTSIAAMVEQHRRKRPRPTGGPEQPAQDEPALWMATVSGS